MDNLNLIDTFSEFKDLKSIDRATMMSVLEDSFRSVLQKQFGTDENFDVIINYYRYVAFVFDLSAVFTEEAYGAYTELARFPERFDHIF